MDFNVLYDLLLKPGNFGDQLEGAELSIDLAGMRPVNPIALVRGVRYHARNSFGD
jgi:hypothetical protein